MTYIAPDAVVRGDLEAEGAVRVDGTVLGSVRTRGDLEVAPGGRVQGEVIEARDVAIHGQVQARVEAQGRLVLTKSGRLEGDVVAQALDIEAGAVFVGRSKTGEAAPAFEPAETPLEE